MRIVDPDEVARSCTRSTIGSKLGKNDPTRNDCMFRAFQCRHEAIAEASALNKALEANPAALIRSQGFHERN